MKRTGPPRTVDGFWLAVPAIGPLIAPAIALAQAAEPSMLDRFRDRLADPNAAFVLLTLGALSLIFELANPGIVGAGTLGVILILLGIYGISDLPVNTLGALLMLLALGLFIGEVFAPGTAAFAGGGVIALIFGGWFLFDGIRVSSAILFPMALAIGGGVVLAGRVAMRARTAPNITGADALVGVEATIRRVSDGRAQVFVEGAWWNARAPAALEVGTPVTVVGVDGLDLLVEEKKGDR